MKILNYPSRAAEARVRRISLRGRQWPKKELAAVNRMVGQVRRRGDEALLAYTRRFDAPGFTREELRVSTREMAAAAAAVDRPFLRALRRAAAQIEDFHRRQLRTGFITAERPGTVLGQIVRPVDRVGVYVPGGRGGKTPLVSSVLMGAIPARVAGVARIVMVTPPMADGTINPHLLLAAKTAGVEEVYKVGSAWGIAALAFGTETVPNVDVIVGPGNLYVTLAKKIVAGTVGIDIIAGPSEILVVADASADPEFVAADMLSQAEHDPLASALLVTPSGALAAAARTALVRQAAALARAEIALESLRRFGAIFVTQSLAAAIELANRVAPEHLELQVRDPFACLGSIRNAGAVFLGAYTPEAVGDYMAGPNHVLPTAGTARFASALSVDHFLKRTSILHYAADALHREGPDIVRLAEVEGLTAHARSVRLRLAGQDGGEPAV
ncbi:MAG: histidinol dehydrogenase [Desulfobacteraceae bacterium]|nr:MAG: histidinol dehydrogenase [Desulfobacteraceae bacterium]